MVQAGEMTVGAYWMPALSDSFWMASEMICCTIWKEQRAESEVCYEILLYYVQHGNSRSTSEDVGPTKIFNC